MPTNRLPSLRHHKASGRAFVELTRGRHTYLGAWGDPATERAYHRLMAEYSGNGNRLPVPVDVVTVLEVTAAYLDHCEAYYLGRYGEPTSTIYEIKRVIKTMGDLYGDQPAASFGPLALRACRDCWIKDGLTITTINKYCSRVRALFKWAVANQMATVESYQSLCCVAGLRRGRGVGRETLPRQAVALEHVEATLLHMPSPLRAIIRLLLLTGARPTEVLRLQRRDIDCNGPVWSAVVREHKLSYRGVKRTLYFGPRAQAILRPFLLRGDDEYLFSPIEAERERHAAEREKSGGLGRRPWQKPNRKKSTRVIGYFYDANDLTRAIRRVCQAHDIPVWTAYQLRHTACTTIEATADADTARAILGHSTLDTTAIYLHRDATAATAWAATHG